MYRIHSTKIDNVHKRKREESKMIFCFGKKD